MKRVLTHRSLIYCFVTAAADVTILPAKLKHRVAPAQRSSGKESPVRIDSEAIALAAVSGALGIVAALTFSAPTAVADPAAPDPAPEPTPAVAPANPFPWLPLFAPPPAPEPVAAPADPAVPTPAPAAGTVQTAAAPATPPNGVPHLSSPENLPPGTTDTPDPQSRGSYLRDLWHAYQTQEISGRDALLLLSQRPMNPAPAPPPGMPVNPTPPPPPDPAPPLLPTPTP
jgi:hypothetical protein